MSDTDSDSDIQPNVFVGSRVSGAPLVPSTSGRSSNAGSRRIRLVIINDSDSDSGSSIDVRHKRRRIPRVGSDEESNSSGSVIVRRPRKVARVASDSSSECTSQWETDGSDCEDPMNKSVKMADNGFNSDSSDEQSEKCPICLLSLTNQEIGTPATCDHVFCVDCIVEWSKNSNTCPVDRKEYGMILVRKSINGDIYRQISVAAARQTEVVDVILEDPTFCEICGSSDREDRMLLCDGCDLGFHLDCLSPALTDVPSGSWFCNDCSPEDTFTSEIELYELQLLLDDSHDIPRPLHRRRANAPRLVPRTRHSERVRRSIATNRRANSAVERPTEHSQLVSSSSSRPQRRKTRRKKTKPRYRTIYQLDDVTGETVAVKKRIRRRRKKRRTVAVAPKTVKTRLARQLGMCRPRTTNQSLPEVKVPTQVRNIQTQRYNAGIPTLDLFGHRDALSDFDGSDGETGSMGVAVRRAPNRADVATLRRARVKAMTLPNPASVSSTTDLLDSILDAQTKLYSKSTILQIGPNGSVGFNDYDRCLRRAPAAHTNSTTSEVPSSSGTALRGSSPNGNNPAPTSTVDGGSGEGGAYGHGEEDNGGINPEGYLERSVCPGDSNTDKKLKKNQSQDNTPRSGSPLSESEIDIYSDIETVSTSKAEDIDFKIATPEPILTHNSDDDNDSESGMVIDTQPQVESEEDIKSDTAVTSTVDNVTNVTSTSDIQSSNPLFGDPGKVQDYEEDSEDGCPNFSIYSKESITMAKNTDVTLMPTESTEIEQVGEISSSPVALKPIPKKVSTGLYSDSEDESVVKKVVQSSFGITDIRNITEDISEEERSYTPCLDEREDGIEGLDTEMISDEERNDFDESHDLKTASDGGEALEINAKESELDFTRPEDYEEGEIVDKLKTIAQIESSAAVEETVIPPIKEDEPEKSTVDENAENKETDKDSPFKKISKNNKERNYRDKDNRERSKSREKTKSEKETSKKDKRKRKELKRYDVRALIADKPRAPRRNKDQFGRDLRRSGRQSDSVTPPGRQSSQDKRSLSEERSRKKRKQPRNRRSLSRSPSHSEDRGKRSRSKTKKRRRSPSKERRRKSQERSKPKNKKKRSRSRHKSRSITPKRPGKERGRRQSRDWTPSFSRSRTPEPRRLTPSWTPPRIMDNTVKPHNLTVILTNNSGKKKKEKKKKTKENDKQKKKKREKTPLPSKEVFASGDNILVSVSFNKDSEASRDVSTKRKRDAEEVVASKKVRKEKRTRTKTKTTRDLSGIKPVAIIDLDKSPFKEITPSPNDVIILSDSENEENRGDKGASTSSQQAGSPVNNYSMGPKTPPEPQVKFTLNAKLTQIRAITNPLHEPDDVEPETDAPEVVDGYKGPNTPPEPPNSPPSSPDAYDPFEPTKSQSASPEPQMNQSNSTSHDDNRDDSIIEGRNISGDMDKTQNSVSLTPEALKSHTPPLADIQPADSQSSIHATPESSLSKSPERTLVNSLINQPLQAQTSTATLKAVVTTPFSSVATSVITSTPVNSNPARINILSTTILPHIGSAVPQRIVLPNIIKSSPAKISPIKTPLKIVASSKTRKSNGRNQNGSDTAMEATLSLDSPYSPGSSDYEDLFEPPSESSASKSTTKAAPPKNTKSPNKAQNVFDTLFGSPFNKTKPKGDNKSSKFNKKPAPSSKGNTKQVGVKIDEDNLKILDDLPNSAVEMQVKDKFLKKLNRQERVVEEVKLVLKPHYNKKHISKEEYKDILRRAVPKICHNKSGEINPNKIKNLIEAYVKKVRHNKKVTSSSNSVNPQKA